MERYKLPKYLLCGVLLLLITAASAQESKIWTGAVSQNWSEASNWQPAGQPQSLSQVIIKKPANGNLPILDSNSSIQNLTIELGASLTINGYTLTIDGNFKAGTSGIVSDHLVMANANDELIINGNATFAARTKLEAGRIVLRGNLVQESVNVAIQPNATVFVFDGTSPQTVRFQRPGTNNQSFFNNVIVRNPAGVSFLSDVHVTGLLQLESAGRLAQQDSVGTYFHHQLPRTNGGEYHVRKSYVAGQIVLDDDRVLSHAENNLTILARNALTLNGHRLRVGGTFTVKAFVEQKHLILASATDALEIEGDAIFEGFSTLTAGTISVRGNLTQKTSSAALQPAGTVFVLDGAQPQTVRIERPGIAYRSFLQDVVIKNPTSVNFATDVYLTGRLTIHAGSVAQGAAHGTYFTTALPVIANGNYAVVNSYVAGPIALEANLTLPNADNHLAVLPRNALTLNGHTLEIGGNFKAGAFSAEKHLIMNNAADLLIVNGDATFEGLNVLHAGTLVLRGNLTQAISAAAIQPEGTALVFDGKETQIVSFERPGTGNRSYLREVTINHAASVRALTNVFVTGQINNYGKLEVIDTRALFLSNAAGINHRGGMLVGNGTVNTPTMTFTNDGNVRPGASPGVMRITGSYLQRPVGKLTIEIGGLAVATQYSRLEVSGSATLDGALELELANGFKASVGDSFRVMSFGSATGQFAQVLSTPPKNVEFQLRYKATGVDVVAVQAANRAPLAQNDSAATRTNTPLTLNVLRNDLDANEDPLQVSALELTNTIGKAEIAGDSSITYTPKENFRGVDSFGYTASDGRGGMSAATVFVNVASANQGPSTFSLLQPQDGAIINLVAPVLFRWQAAQDANGDALVYSVRLFNAAADTTIENIKATELRFNGRGFLRGATAYQWLVLVSDAEFTTASADTFSFSTATVSSVDAQLGQLPEAFALEQNYPNPFNPSTAISFALPAAEKVSLAIYNLNGQLVKKLVAGEMKAGRHSLVWEATNDHGARVTSGVYVYVIKAGNFTAQKRLVLMK